MLNAIQTAEQNLIATLKSATAALNAVGTNELAAALADLERAAAEARARLDAAAGKARTAFSALAADAGQIAASLSADLGLTPAQTKQQAAQEEKAEAPATAATDNPLSVDPAVESVREEIASINRGGLTETRGTSPLPAHLLPALVAASTRHDAQEASKPDGESAAAPPSSNGKGHGRRRRGG